MTELEIFHMKERLKTKGVTLTKIARELDLTKGHISQVIRGRTDSGRVWRAIIGYLGHDPREVQAGDPPSAA